MDYLQLVYWKPGQLRNVSIVDGLNQYDGVLIRRSGFKLPEQQRELKVVATNLVNAGYCVAEIDCTSFVHNYEAVVIELQQRFPSQPTEAGWYAN